MGSRGVSLEQVVSIPNTSRHLPEDKLYVRLGCIGCLSQICFIADGITSMLPEWSRNSDDAKELMAGLSGVEKKAVQHQSNINSWDLQCATPCPQSDDMEITVDLLNDSFGASLTTRNIGK